MYLPSVSDGYLPLTEALAKLALSYPPVNITAEERKWFKQRDLIRPLNGEWFVLVRLQRHQPAVWRRAIITK